MSGSAKGTLEKSGAQDLHAALTHFGVPFPLAALAQAGVVAHKGLESGGRLAIAPGVQNFIGQEGEDFGGIDRSKAGDRFQERFALWLHALRSQGFDLMIECAQALFHGRHALEHGQ